MFGCARKVVGARIRIISYKMQPAACFLWGSKFCILWEMVLIQYEQEYHLEVGHCYLFFFLVQEVNPLVQQ